MVQPHHTDQVRAMSLDELGAGSAESTVYGAMCRAEINRRVAAAQIASAEAAAVAAQAAAASARHTRNSVIALVVTAAIGAVIQVLAWRFPVDHAYDAPRPAPSSTQSPAD